MHLAIERDVDAIFVLFLGRLPEHTRVYSDYLGRTVAEAVEDIVASDEFRVILDAFLREGAFPHCALPPDARRNAIELAVETGLASPGLMEYRSGPYRTERLMSRSLAECIEAAYRVILRRETDAEGREYYFGLSGSEAAVKRQLVEDLLESDEFSELGQPLEVVWPDEPDAGEAGAEADSSASDWIGELAIVCGSEFVNRTIVALHSGLGSDFVARLDSLAADRSPRQAEDTGRQFDLCLDLPVLFDGAAELSVQRAMRISGWAAAPEGIAAVDITVDGEPSGPIHYGLVRLDVAAAHPECSDAAHSGFHAMIPRWQLPPGRHVVRIAASSAGGAKKVLEFGVEVRAGAENLLSLRRKIHQSEIELNNRILTSLEWHPKFVLLLSIGSGPAEIARGRATLSSLRRQAYFGWRVAILRSGRIGDRDQHRARLIDGSENLALLRRLNGAADLPSWRSELLSGFEDIADRLCFAKSSARELLVKLIEPQPTPAFFVPLTAGDELSADALLELAVASGIDRKADFFYSDELRPSPASNLVEPFLKPDWSPDLLLSTNYIGRLWCATASLLERIAATADELVGFGEYDLVLRATEAAAGIQHVPQLLCQRGGEHIDSERRERAALRRAMERRRIAGDIRDGCVAGTYRLQRAVTKRGLVSVILPTCAARGLVKTCIETLRGLTAYRRFEIVAIENIPPADSHWKEWLRQAADKTIETTEPYNWARFTNLAAAEAAGEYLLFLNDDIEIVEPGWLDALLEHAQRPEIASVGPQLLYPDRTVQHAGMFLMPKTGWAEHAFRGAPEDDPGYFGLALTQRNVIAVTGACMLTRRELFEKLGRFNEAHRIVNNDLDYCLRAWRQGLLTVFTPYAKLLHHERASRSALPEEYRVREFEQQWRAVFTDGDPYHHRNLSKDALRFMPEPEPVRLIKTATPLFEREAVRSILVVKLDHIGDGVISFPAIRRLKQHFPNAALRLLAGNWTRQIWSFTDIIDEVIDFDCFHARSALGVREVTEAELRSLAERLAPYRFDLAVDLRKHPETRHILQYTGARLLAGFDYQGRFPWLDIALEWTGDGRSTPKRQPVGNDLINLVDAIAASCEPSPAVIRPLSADPLPLSDGERGRLFGRRVVCVHPGVGEPMRQWPTEYFIELIDHLVEREAVNIALIGNSGDREVEQEILRRVRHRRHVWSFVSRLGLDDVPKLMVRCALFVGNNSGPHHLAAALGVPTIGIHSAVIDTREWCPSGPNAVALRRDMDCGPCYLATPPECPRALACLIGLRPGEVYQACRRLLAIGFGRAPGAATARERNAPQVEPALGRSAASV
jgi:ADP-heptose:LPS heptosyltransferase/GT2 family glycosyltransferase